MEGDLRADYPDRDFDVVAGDCNARVGPVLHSLRDWNRAPTFALIDQHAAEVHWSTLEQLSRFKPPDSSKAELWLLFAPSMLPRGLASIDSAAGERFTGRISAMYGSDEWLDLYDARRRGLLSGEDLRDELLNLMRWRLETELGYRITHSFGMKNTRGAPLYNMVFATDHPAGERIMNHIYERAAEAQPQMRAEAVAILQAKREDKSGEIGLFPPIPRAVRSTALYEHQPPTPPYRLPAD